MDTKNLMASLLVVALFTVPGTVADRNQDGDPLGDTAEDAICGYPDVRMALELLGGTAGECSGDPDFDYSNDAFGDAVVCNSNSECRTQVAVAFDVALNDDVDVESVPLPPEAVPSFGPFPVGPFGTTVVTLEGYKGDPGDYCVQVTPGVGSPPPPLCVGSPLLHDEGPDTGPQELGEVDEHDAGPTPGVEEGQFGDSPPQHVGKTFLDVEVVAHWHEDRLHRVTGLGDVEVWEPVLTQDPGEVLWWQSNPDATRVDVHYSWHYGDGSPVCGDCQGTHSVPYAGQVYGALVRTP